MGSTRNEIPSSRHQRKLWNKVNPIGTLGALVLALGVVMAAPALSHAQSPHHKKISSGWGHTLVVRDDGTVWGWGDSRYGQLPSSTTAARQISGISSAVAVAAGEQFSLALKSDGTVWAWGTNSSGQLGNGTTTNSSTPVQVTGLTGVAAIAVGNAHGIAVKSNGSVWTWGINNYGQLGDGTTTNNSTPTQVSGLTGAVAAAGSENHTLVLKGDGTMWSWGNNISGQLGTNGTSQSLTPVEVGGITTAASIDCWGQAGDGFSVALLTDGTIWSWGRNMQGNFGDGSFYGSRTTPEKAQLFSNSNTSVEAMYWGVMAVQANGSVLACGGNLGGQLGNGDTATQIYPVAVSNLTNVQAISGGFGHAAAITSSGKVYAWGKTYPYDAYGKVGDDSTFEFGPTQLSSLQSVKQVAGGLYTAMALKEDGKVYAWGPNDFGQLGIGSTVSQSLPAEIATLSNVRWVDAGRYHIGLAVKSDGTVWTWGHNLSWVLGDGTSTIVRTAPVQVLNLTGVTKAVMGSYHSLAVKSDGTVWSWGSNSYGELGRSTSPASLAGQISGLSGITDVAAGDAHSIALKSDGTVWTWGKNSDGQVGNGTTTDQTTPIQVAGLSGIIAIACGSNHSMALKSDGTLWVWGKNEFGQLDDGTTTSSSTPTQVTGLTDAVKIGACVANSIAVRSNGEIWIRGDDSHGQVSNAPTGQRIAMADGTTHGVIAIKEDGGVIFWGDGTFGTSGEGLPWRVDAFTPGLVRGLNIQQDVATVAITSPSSSPAAGVVGQGQQITVAFTPGDGTATSVSLYHHGVLLGTDNSAPYTFTFTPWTWGDFELRAIGMDSLGNPTSRSAPVTVSVPYDSDSDGLPDWWENDYLGNLVAGAGDDSDGDGLTNAQELAEGAHPGSWDTDGDGFSDGFEVAKSKDPLDAQDFPALVHNSSIRRIAAGMNHTVAVKEDGTVWAWGYNGYGSVSDRYTSWLWPHIEGVPLRVGTLTGAISVAAGYHHNLVLKSDGTVWTWGGSFATPIQVSGLSNITAVAAGDVHSLVLKADGTVWAWGTNASGQLGDGSTTDRPAPVQVSGLTDVVAVAAAENHSLAVKSDGTVWAWGLNNDGQLGDGTTTQRLYPVQVSGITTAVSVDCGCMWGASPHSVALLSDGTVMSWGHNQRGQLGDGTTTTRLTPVQATGVSGIVEVVAGRWYTAALKSDGTVWTWGANEYGQLGNGTRTGSTTAVQVSGLTNVVAICADLAHAGAITSDGKVTMWGLHEHGRTGDDSTFVSKAPIQSSGVVDVKQVVAGPSHGVAVKADGTVWVWGNNDTNQLGNATGLSKADPIQVPGFSTVVAASAGSYHTVVVKGDGTAWAWGGNWMSQLGDGTTAQRSGPVQVTGLTGATKVATGHYHNVVLMSDGTVQAWGNNNSGELGDNSTTMRSSPVAVSGLTNVTSVAAGGVFSMALKADGTVWAWGENGNGQLGNAGTTDSPVPVQVPGLTNVVGIACGSEHGMAVKADGTLWTWGSNAHGQLGDGTQTSRNSPAQVSGVTNAVAVSAGWYHSLALTDQGDVWSSGPDWGFQTGDGSTGHRMTQISAGAHFSAAVKEDGSMILWGSGTWGQLAEGLPWNVNTWASRAKVKGLNILYSPPVPVITAPTPSPKSVALGQSQSVTVGLTPGDSYPTSVSLYHHGVLVGTDTSPPYTYTFTPWTWGSYELRAVAIDPLGQETERSLPLWIETPYDSDSDGLPDWWELSNFGSLGSTSTDPDADGLSNALEWAFGTNPLLADTDGDGSLDGQDARPLDPGVGTLHIIITYPASGSTIP